jgi:dienelactone hydrolase
MPLEAASTIQFTSALYNVAENAGTVALTVQRTDDVDTVVQVDYASADGTAIAGKKYVAFAGTLDFATGQTNKLIVVSILNESFVEGTQTFQVILSNPAGGAVLGLRTNATVRITDNDTGLEFEFASYSVSEDAGSVLIGVVRGDDGDFPVAVEYATSDGTATAGSDYTQTSGTFLFAAGEKVKLFTVPIVNDSGKEVNKTFKLTLSNPTGGAVLGSRNTVTVTIVDNDPGVQFESNQYLIQEKDGELEVKVFRGNDVDLGAFTVDYATTNLTAKAAQDYVETSGTLAFAAGETVKTVSVPILYHAQPRGDAKFRLTLNNPSGGRILGTNRIASITILDSTHRLDGVSVLPHGSFRLSVGGGVSTLFRPYFDLYPIEVSTNLVDWAPFVTLQRTNSSTNAFTYVDNEAAHSDMRFYRTFANQFITPIPKPTGPYAVGVVSRLVTDSTRRNRYGISTNGSFMVSYWYPAQAEAGQLPGAFLEKQLAEDPGYADIYTDRVSRFVAHSLPSASIATNEVKYPVIIYVPGYSGIRAENQEKFAHLASHGYIVISADHWKVYGTVFPDGRYLHGSSVYAGETSDKLSDPNFAAIAFKRRIQDVRIMLADLDRADAADSILAGHVDTHTIGLMGFSFGGGVAGEICRTDDRCRAALVLDAYLQGADELRQAGLQKPFLGMYNSGGGDLTLFNKAVQGAVWFLISNTVHSSFVDVELITDPTPANRQVAFTINAYLVSFFNKYLKGQDDHLLDGPSANFPRVINFKKK